MSDSETAAGTNDMPSGTGNVATDTRDMVGIHNTFRRALGDAPAQIRAVPEGDPDRALRLGDYLSEVLWLLEVHHEGEDELLYPLLEQRAPEHLELFRQMGAQHASVHTSLEAAKTAAKHSARRVRPQTVRQLRLRARHSSAATEDHLSEEEEMVLPIAEHASSPHLSGGQCRLMPCPSTAVTGSGYLLGWRSSRCPRTFSKACWPTYRRQRSRCGPEEAPMRSAKEMAQIRGGS